MASVSNHFNQSDLIKGIAENSFKYIIETVNLYSRKANYSTFLTGSRTTSDMIDKLRLFRLFYDVRKLITNH